MEHLIKNLSDEEIQRLSNAARVLPSDKSQVEQLAGIILAGVHLVLEAELDDRHKRRTEPAAKPGQSSPTTKG